MATAIIRPGAFLRRGRAGVSAHVMMFLIEHKEELQAVYDALDARRDAALEAISASEAKLASTEAREAALREKREAEAADLIDVIVKLEAREEAVARGKKALVDLNDWIEANPIKPMEKWPAYTAPPRRSKEN